MFWFILLMLGFSLRKKKKKVFVAMEYSECLFVKLYRRVYWVPM